VALGIRSGEKADIWIWDLARKILNPLAFDKGIRYRPLWTPDGKRIVFASGQNAGKAEIYWRAADGTGTDEPFPSRSDQSYSFPSSWSGDGKTLLLVAIGGPSPNFDIGALPVESGHTVKWLLKERYSESQPKISPDGNWMAYTSNKSEQNEIYVCPFPNVEAGDMVQVSTSGGDSPLWSPDGDELFYRNGDEVIGVKVATKPAFRPGTPETLFRQPYVSSRIVIGGAEFDPWDIHPKDKRFLMMKEVASNASKEEKPRKINIVLNWAEELKQKVPAK
jgi:Tol biopolymer transport system component